MLYGDLQFKCLTCNPVGFLSSAAEPVPNDSEGVNFVGWKIYVVSENYFLELGLL